MMTMKAVTTSRPIREVFLLPTATRFLFPPMGSPQSQYQNVSYLTKMIGSYKKVRTTQGQGTLIF